MSQTIAKWGHSAAVRIPSKVLKNMDMAVGDKVEVKVFNRQIIIEPAKPTLAQLLSQITDENRHDEVITETMGNELL
ncbi:MULTISPECIES: AbrB/MazE/SpoVT family DNA-binding domain-containing protein [Vibrio]|uniref:MazF family transcriptional regulator n=2 Tax=Vibrio harveyi group TaxID=717610 RepID=A0AAW3IU19_VIBPH|nr:MULTISPECIES: AbrB/MazE/SpoVT family DNA-binding domain-containing protein [Vibrio]ARR48054.1 AbrB/MazE/SpoVT family DNA-binding domain-containing protein [Vibrio campbellii]EGQ8536076.1 AbrB/MazE/SpoVT family DNA-binding domain-containing protein [Vibrio parahaemolyticus]EHK7406639.1 AbrB/MazE/SpoVT family DNA-binding domain-containing protein [Vibrio parahaemolyticus]EJB8409578.1 AbrB/MazE/SpoVT family DNA-binding domain-containing protein [Vibrio parahaemolyticus]EJB8445102.1 AbrB/MazE/S